jgi:hypothetical protein
MRLRLVVYDDAPVAGFEWLRPDCGLAAHRPRPGCAIASRWVRRAVPGCVWLCLAALRMCLVCTWLWWAVSGRALTRPWLSLGRLAAPWLIDCTRLWLATPACAAFVLAVLWLRLGCALSVPWPHLLQSLSPPWALVTPGCAYLHWPCPNALPFGEKSRRLFGPGAMLLPRLLERPIGTPRFMGLLRSVKYWML